MDINIENVFKIIFQPTTLAAGEVNINVSSIRTWRRNHSSSQTTKIRSTGKNKDGNLRHKEREQKQENVVNVEYVRNLETIIYLFILLKKTKVSRLKKF